MIFQKHLLPLALCSKTIILPQSAITIEHMLCNVNLQSSSRWMFRLSSFQAAVAEQKKKKRYPFPLSPHTTAIKTVFISAKWVCIDWDFYLFYRFILFSFVFFTLPRKANSISTICSLVNNWLFFFFFYWMVVVFVCFWNCPF